MTIAPADAEESRRRSWSSARDENFGLISDIDDTVITTSLPRPIIAAWNTFVKSENARHVVPGMATMYRALLDGAPRCAHGLRLDRGLEHRAHAHPVPAPARVPGRAAAAHRLGADQHRAGSAPARTTSAPACTVWPTSSRRSAGYSSATTASTTRKIYGDFSTQRPDRVAAIAIRELTPSEQVLSHGIPVSLEEFEPLRERQREVPVCRAGDGYGLLNLLRAARVR